MRIRLFYGLIPLVALLCLTVSTRPALPDQQAATRPVGKYRITIWVVRPVVKHVPTQKELDEGSHQWFSLAALQNPPAIKEDADLLAWLRRSNPRLHFPKVESKHTRIVSPEETWTVPLEPSSRLVLRLCLKDRERILEELTRNSSPAVKREFLESASGKLILWSEGQTRFLNPVDSSGAGVKGINGESPGPTFRGYCLLKPAIINILNPSIHFFTAYERPANRRSGPMQPHVRQLYTDVLLRAVEPLP